MMALGAIQYLQDHDIKNVLVAGFDNLSEAQASLENGQLQATVDQQAALQGYTGVAYAIDLLNGQNVPSETIMEPKLVTSDMLQ